MKEIIRSFFGILISSYFGSIIFLLFGIWLIYFTVTNPQENRSSPLQGDIKGWAGGIGSIVLGLLILYWKLSNKL